MGSQHTRNEGVLASWNDERGFGFVTIDSGEQIFAHISAFPSRDTRPTPGERVSFAEGHTTDGKLRAHSIRYLAAPQVAQAATRRRPETMSYAVLLVFAAAIVLATATRTFPSWVAALYLLTSIACYVAYAIDKSAAQNRQWRVSEGALLGIGLLGGWPGAIVAQQRLRHKTLKTNFRQAFWGTVALNVLVLAVMATPLRQYVVELVRLMLSTTSS